MRSRGLGFHQRRAAHRGITRRLERAALGRQSLFKRDPLEDSKRELSKGLFTGAMFELDVGYIASEHHLDNM